jgi:hypothetical protein
MAGMLADSRAYRGFDSEIVNGGSARKDLRRRMKRRENRDWSRTVRREEHTS